ncbi:unnamed protein product [Protopolystoma xenopodis]|uniref:Uncharacterized protein n=1 Tax=Protopolystoma xenopodis TaxID=117903 RepID=A0A3S5B449_9PLAT|nr:unnamed protein product [Protopolystoma xenopodis]
MTLEVWGSAPELTHLFAVHSTVRRLIAQVVEGQMDAKHDHLSAGLTSWPEALPHASGASLGPSSSFSQSPLATSAPLGHRFVGLTDHLQVHLELPPGDFNAYELDEASDLTISHLAHLHSINGLTSVWEEYDGSGDCEFVLGTTP